MIKQVADCRGLVSALGLNPNRSGMIQCPDPAHNDKTPSCKVYHDGLFCFGCGRRFSAVDLVMLSKNIAALDAAKWLAARAGVSLPIGNAGAKVTKRRITTGEKDSKRKNKGGQR